MNAVEILAKIQEFTGSMAAVIEHHGIMCDVVITRANRFGLVVAGNALPKSGETIVIKVGDLQAEAIIGLQNRHGGSLIFVQPARISPNDIMINSPPNARA